MGKVSVTKTKKKERHNPLERDIYFSSGTFKSAKVAGSEEEAGAEQYIDAVTSRKILHLAVEQQKEIESEDADLMKTTPFSREPSPEVSDSEESDQEEYSDFEERFEETNEEDYEVAENDAALFLKYFLAGNTATEFNLGDKIMSLIQQKEDFKTAEAEQPGYREKGVHLPPKVIAVYQKIGQILSTYTRGKLPKLFKVLPTLNNWEDVLYVTDPERWTPHALYEATKLFVSNLQANDAQRFVETVLLDKFRAAIQDSEKHTLDYHTYRAIRKSLYKPGAFFKGFLLPLVDNHCTVREATIAASVLAKVSVPVLHSSVALTQLLQRDFNPAATVFIRVLLEKRYALPYQTLDELVFYFMRFREAAQKEMGAGFEKLPPLPVAWHKAFLAFAQRYKNDITDDQRDYLLETVRQRFHHAIGSEIRRELLSGSPRLEM